MNRPRITGPATAPLALAAAAILATGCGNGLVPVTGRVTLDGGPLAGAKVAFVPAGAGIPASGTTDDAGRFSLAIGSGRVGVPAGRYLVTVAKVQVSVVDAAKARTLEADRRGGVDLEPGPDGLVQVVEYVVPRRYADPAASGVEAEVPGPEEYVFELQSKP